MTTTAMAPCKHEKCIYHTADHAQRVACARALEAGHPLYVYWCDDCHGYHLTKRDPKTWNQKPPRARILANRLERALGPIDFRHSLWGLCLRLSSSERKTLGALTNPAVQNVFRRYRETSTRLHDLLRQIDSAWLDRGRYVKSDVIEAALREFRDRGVSA